MTYLALDSGKWQSLDLTQDTTDTTLWTGTLTTAAPIQFMVQAVDGVGLVTLDTNAGVYYQPNQIAPALQTAGALPATALGLGSFATSAPYGSSPTLSATLTSAGSPVASRAVTFTVGNSIRTGITNASGKATVQLPLINLPAGYKATASFGGDATLAGTSVSAPFTITALSTSLSLGSGGAPVLDGADTGIEATLTSGGAPLPQRTIEFVLTQGGTQVVQTRITDASGVAALGAVPQALNGTYSVQAFFGPGGPTPPTLAADPVYTASSASGASLTVNQAGTLTVKKLVVNDNGGTAVATNFKFTVNCGTATSFKADPGNNDGLHGLNTVTVPPGSYSVAEDGTPITYTATLSAGCTGTVAGGGSAECTITNDDNPPVCNDGTGVTGAAYNSIPRRGALLPAELGLRGELRQRVRRRVTLDTTGGTSSCR